MRLILAVVSQRDAPAIMAAVVAAKLQVTKLASMGGFLKKGNVTLLVGADDARVDEALEIMTSARARTGSATRAEGGVAFVLTIDRFVRVDQALAEASSTE